MKKLLIALVATLSLLACKKSEDNGLTDVSENGEYFNCFIDGKYWTFKQCTFCNNDALESYQYQQAGTITGNYIKGESSDFPQTGITFNIDQVAFLAGDTMQLGKNPSRLLSGKGLSYAKIHRPFAADTTSWEYMTDSLHTGRLIYTKRTAQWLEGSFSFDAANAQGSVVSVTNGRFAISLD